MSAVSSTLMVKMENCLWYVCIPYAIFSYCTLVHKVALAGETRLAGQKGWTVGINATGTWQQWSKCKLREDINGMLSDSAGNEEYRVISLWESEPERPAWLHWITLAVPQLENYCNTNPVFVLRNRLYQKGLPILPIFQSWENPIDTLGDSVKMWISWSYRKAMGYTCFN